MEKDPCTGVVYLTVLSDNPHLVSLHLPLCYPYIVLHFKYSGTSFIMDTLGPAIPGSFLLLHRGLPLSEVKMY